MKTTIKVSARREGYPCPKSPRGRVTTYTTASGEKRDRTMIYHDEVIEVPNERYYRRRIIKGDLIKATAKKPTSSSSKTTTKTTKGDSK